VITTSTDSDSSLPEPLAQFEQELAQASDPGPVLERYRRRYPELAETLGKMAEAMAMLQETPLRQPGEAPASQAEAPRPERFGPYKVVRTIGRGGMGEVYEAIEEPLGRHVAIKTLRRQATSRSLLARFDRERRTLARLHHTNVVPIYATGSEGDLLQVSGLPPSGLEDSHGRLIDGNYDGQPGGNAVSVLRNGGATVSAVVYQGIGTVPPFEPAAIDALLEQPDMIRWLHTFRPKRSRQ
jgi:hypothetical protein